MQVAAAVGAGRFGEGRALGKRAMTLAPDDMVHVLYLGIITYLDGGFPDAMASPIDLPRVERAA
jgi:hypothetical protein